MNQEKAKQRKRSFGKGRTALLFSILIGFCLSFAIGSFNSYTSEKQTTEMAVYKSPLVWRTDGAGDYLLSELAADGTYELAKAVKTGSQIKSLTATWRFKGQVTLEFSVDNGKSYSQVVYGVPFDLAHSGNQFKWRVTLGLDSQLFEIKIAYTDTSGAGGSFGEPRLSGFKFKKSLYITNPSGEELFNYQIPLSVGQSTNASVSGTKVVCEGKAKADFGDIRFTAADRETILPYFLESITGKSPNRKAIFWVKVPQIPLEGLPIYVYYGNPQAQSLSSGKDVFDFFDDFSQDELDREVWEIDTGLGGSYELINSRLKLNGTAIKSKDYQFKDGIIEYQAKSEIGFENRLIIRTDDAGLEQVAYSSAYEGAEHCLAIGGIVKANQARPISAGAVYRYKVIARGDDLNFERYSKASVFGAKVSHINRGGLKKGHIGLRVGENNVTYFDWLKVRKYLEPEPYVSASGDEAEVSLAEFSGTTLAGNGNVIRSLTDTGETEGVGEYITAPIFTACDVSAITPRVKQGQAAFSEAISMDISANGGLSWKEDCESGKTYIALDDFAIGKELLLRADFSADDGIATPELEELELEYSIAPRVFSANVYCSGATGEQGTYIAGDSIIVEWDNSASGDNNPDIASVSCNFAPFGGESLTRMYDNAGDNIYTVEYKIPEDIVATANIFVTATNLCGITTRDGHILSIDTSYKLQVTSQEEEAVDEEVTSPEDVVSEEAAVVEESVTQPQFEVGSGVAPARGLNVAVYSAQSEPDDFYLKDEQGRFVPYIFRNISPTRYEVVIKSKKGKQKYLFTPKGVALLENEGSGFQEKVKNSWFYVQKKGLFPWQWDDVEPEDGQLSYSENGDGTINIYNKSPQGTLTAKLGFNGDEYYNKFSVEGDIRALGSAKKRVHWDTVFSKKDLIKKDNTNVRRRVRRKVKRFLIGEREEVVNEEVFKEKLDNVVIDWKDFIATRKEQRKGKKRPRAERMRAAGMNNRHKASAYRVWFYEDGKQGDITIDPVLSTTQSAGTITVQTGGLTTSDFKLVFKEANAGVSEFYKGTGSASWSTNYGSTSEFLTESDQDSSVQVDWTSTLKLLEANSTRVRVENKFSLGPEADITEEWSIYPGGKIVKRIKYEKLQTGTEARRVDDGATDYVATGMSGYHPSTPSTTRGTGTYYDTQIIELIATDTGEISDYQSPGTLSMVTGTAETAALGDDDSEGFNEGEGAYEIRSASNKFAFGLDGSSQTKYKPAFKASEVYPVSASGSHILAHYRLDEVTGTAVDNAEGTANRDATVSEAVETDITSAIARRGKAFNIKADGENLAITSANLASDWSKGTIEFWYKPNYDFVGAQSEAKYLFGSAASGTANAIWARVYDNSTEATLEFGIKGAANQSSVSITETQDSLWKANGWVHLRFTWDDTEADVCRIYYNGRYVTQTHTDTASAISAVGTNFYFGDYQASGTDNAEGLFDDIYIYNAAILAFGAYHTDFASEYTTPHSDLTLYWNCDGSGIQYSAAGTEIVTKSGTFASALVGYGFLNDAVGEYVQIPAASNISADAGSLSFWLKTATQTPPAEYLFYNDANFNLSFDNQGNLNFQIAGGTSIGSTADYYDAEWHYVRLIWDYTNDVYKIYVDGQEQASSTASLSAPTLADNIFFSATDASGTGGLDGIIDEIYITSSASTPQIQTAYGNAIKTPQLDLDGTLKTQGTDYNCSFVHSASDYILQYLSNVTTDSNVNITDDPSATTKSYSLNEPADITASGSRAAYTVTRSDLNDNLRTAGAETVYLYTTSGGANAEFYDAATDGSEITSVAISDSASSANFWYYDELVGTFTITASDNTSSADGVVGVDDATDVLAAGPASGTTLVFSVQPSTTAIPGMAFGQQPSIVIKDDYGNIDTNDSSTEVTLSAVLSSDNGSAGTGTLSGIVTVTVASGTATYSGLQYDIAESIDLKATATSMTTAYSDAIVVGQSLSLTAPSDTGITWKAGSAHNITWADSQSVVANVKLSYSIDGGTSYNFVIVDSTTDDGSYSWTVPDTLSSTIKVKVEDAAISYSYDVSDNNFGIIKPTLTLLTPSDTGITLNTGQDYAVTWSYDGTVSDNMSLYYSIDSGTTYPNTIATGESNDATYTWSVPYENTATAKVKVEDAFYQALSETNDMHFGAGISSGTKVTGTGNAAAIALTLPGSVTQANMKLSSVDGTAFVDFSDPGVLTNNIGKYLVIQDSAGKRLKGWIKAAGTGETLGSELVTNGSCELSALPSLASAVYANVTWERSNEQVHGDAYSIKVISTSATPNLHRYTSITDTANSVIAVGKLVYRSLWCYYPTGQTGSTILSYKFKNASLGVYFSQADSWQNGTDYMIAPISITTTFTSLYSSSAVGTHWYIDDYSIKQVLTPSTTGATIVSTSGGTTYNWEAEDSGFNRNDPSGYTYQVYDAAPTTGTVTQANMKISAVDSTAFIDFSAADILTDNVGKYLVIKDSAGKRLEGYIKAAGTGETLGSELITNGDMETGDPPTGWGAVYNQIQTRESDPHSGSYALGNLCTGSTGYYISGRDATTPILGLLQYSGWAKKGTGSGTSFYLRSSTPTTLYTSVSNDSDTYYNNIGYATAITSTSTIWLYSLGADGSKTIFDDISLKQVLTPSATGATIVLTASGSTYNWTTEESGFNPNDASGYTYEIYDVSLPSGTFESGVLDTEGNEEFGVLEWQSAYADTDTTLLGAWIVDDFEKHIGVPGEAGFGVGICPDLPAGFSALPGVTNRTSDNYGNYQYTDGSIMVWIPKFYYKIGTGSNGLNVNVIDIKGAYSYATRAAAEADGYALHRVFIDGGVVKDGFFIDKYKCSNNAGVASSIKNGDPISTYSAHNPISELTACSGNYYYEAINAAKGRGANFTVTSRFMHSALAMLSMAHGQAASGITNCAWYDADGNTNFPKGLNNNQAPSEGVISNADYNDSTITYTSDGYSNCGKTGSGTPFAKTTHNGQNCGVTDLNGLMWEIDLGITRDSGNTNFYLLKESVALKDLTSGINGTNDAWGNSAHLATLYDILTIPYITGNDGWIKFGNSTNQVLSESISGDNWKLAGLGIPEDSNGLSSGGTNLFGTDGLYRYLRADLCVLSGGNWGDASTAGVWSVHWGRSRTLSYSYVGFRAACYLE